MWKRIKDIRFAMLTTIDGDGSLVARPMTNVQKEFDGSLWFFTSRHPPPAVAVAAKATVGVQYTDHGSDVYVSLSRDAMFDGDRARKEALWNPMVKAWFPDGLDDPDLVLLRADVHTAEYWQLFKMARAAVTGHPPTDLGEHRTIAM